MLYKNLYKNLLVSAAARKSPDRVLCVRLCHRLRAGLWGASVLISAVSHSEPGRLQPYPEKRNAFITEQQTRRPLGSCRFTTINGWTDSTSEGYISIAAAHWCEHISMCALE